VKVGQTETEKDRATPEQKVRRFFNPFVYGMATANFIAVIQLVSAPQLKVDWSSLVEGHKDQILPFTGFVGMILMTASVPILIGYAVQAEFLVLFKGHLPKRLSEGKMFAAIFFLSFFGMALTLAAFHPAFGISFGLGVIASAIGLTVTFRRLERYDPRP
jgi:hypothetical protein